MTAPNPIGSNFKISFSDAKDLNLLHLEDYTEVLKTTLSSGQYILGSAVSQFEASLSEYLGMPHCVAVGSGTAALELAFESLNLEPTDEVIIQANAYIACAFGALKSNATLKIIDCDLNGCFSVDEFEKAINANTKAVLVVHLYGDSCDMDRVSEICSKKNIHLIEDCAQSLGSEWNNQKLGSFGDISCHSFYPTKNLGAIGDGGAIASNNYDIATYLKKVRNLGSTEKYIHSEKGTNSRMDTFQAGVLMKKLPNLDTSIDMKRIIAERYTSSDLPHIRNVSGYAKHSYHLYVIEVSNRTKIMKELSSRGIETIIHYPVPFYKSKAFEEFNSYTFPNTEYLAERILSIPIHSSLTIEQQDYIISAVKEVIEIVRNE